MKPKSSVRKLTSSRQRPARIASVAILFSLTCVGFVHSADLLTWDVTGAGAVTGSGIATPLALGISGTILTGGGTTGNTTSPPNTWNRSFTAQSDFATATAAGNFFSFSTTVDAGYTVTYDGISGLSLVRTSTGPDMAGLFFSTDGGTTFTQTGSTFTVTATAASAATAFSAGLAATPLVVAGPATVQWRIVVFGGTSNRIGIIKTATNDFALTGTSVSAATKNLTWAGADGDTWNTSLINWAEPANGNILTNFSTNDNATISTAGGIVVTAGGVSPGSLLVDSASGTTSLSGGSITGLTFSKTNAGTLVLNSANTFSGGSTISGGIVLINNATSLGTQLITLAGGTLQAGAAVASISNTLSLAAGGGTIDNASAFSVGAVNNAIVNNPLTKTGDGELNITGALGTQTTGPVNLTITAGSLTLSSASQANLGSTVILNGNLNLSGPVVMLHATDVLAAGTGSIVFKNASSSLTPRFNAGTVNIRRPVVLEADGRADVAAGNNNLNFHGVISGPFNFVKNGNGTATFRVDNTYTGTTTINGNGTLSMNGAGNLGEGEVILASATGTLSFELSQETSVANLISGPGKVAVSVNSQAPVNLTAANTYTGTTTIGGSILRFGGLNPDVTGNISVLSGGALGGNGSAGGAVTIDSGGGLGARISDWTGAAGTGYDDLTVASLDASAGAMVVRIDTTGLVNFTESAASFTILNTTGGITNFNPANVTFSTTGFSGSGTFSLAQVGNSLVLSYAAGAANPYLAWATGAPYNLTGNDALPGSDPDNDGIDNAVEFVIGGNPANQSDVAKLPTAVISGSNLVFTYRLSDLSAYLNPTVQYSSNLTGWTTAQDGVNGVTIAAPTVVEPGIKQIVFTIPQSLEMGSKLFTRLNVVVP